MIPVDPLQGSIDPVWSTIFIKVVAEVVTVAVVAAVAVSYTLLTLPTQRMGCD